MNRRLAAAVTVAAAVLAPTAIAQERFPEFTNYIVDEADVVPDDVEQRLNAELEDYERRSKNEIAVAVIDTVGDRSLEDYTIDLAREWKVGGGAADDGVLFLVAYDDRRLRIEVDRDLEGDLTDLESGRIIRDHVAPRMREGDVGGAIEVGVNEIRRALGDTEVGEAPPPVAQPSDDDGSGPSGIGRALPFLLILPLVLGWRSRMLRARTSPVFWGGGSSARSRRKYDRRARRRDDDDDGGGLLGAVLLGSLLSGGGRGGGWGGGGFGGGGDDGGGFGGFGGEGGGDFGGGGASGDW